ncbi:MAG: MlaD family protein [Cyclobacteriaceae bacterium]|jgi:phospholipid/cholesterol/gamma-HCH transport system substrate-binding protein
MEKSTQRTARLGFLVILGAVIFTATAYLIGQKQDMFRQTFVISVVFNNVNGLQQGNNVRFSGINVGTVLSVTIQSDSVIEVMMRIRESVRPFIKKDAVASIGSDGLMGNMLINISPGSPTATPVQDKDRLRSYSRIKTDDILETLNMTNENAAMLTHNLLEVTQQIKHGNGTLTYLLYDSVMRKDLTQSIRNLKVAVSQTNELLSEAQTIVKRVEQGKGVVGWLLTDTTTADHVRATLSNLDKTSSRITLASDSLQEFVSRLNRDPGLLNALMRDTTIKTDFQETLHNLNESSVKLNENMEAMRSHVLFRGYFKDKEKKAKAGQKP